MQEQKSAVFRPANIHQYTENEKRRQKITNICRMYSAKKPFPGLISVLSGTSCFSWQTDYRDLKPSSVPLPQRQRRQR